MLGDWHQRATVRSRPRRLLGQQLEQQGLGCFPAELTPFIKHPLLASADPKIVREGLMQQLFSYLHFTDRLEHEVVNRTVRKLADGLAGLSLPQDALLDARKIYCDEGYHSLFSADLMFQIQAATGFRFDGGSGHPGLEFFHSAVSAAEPEARAWVELFFVVVSETLISGSLLCIPQADDVIPAVREMAADHAEDEVHHHAFFAKVCRIAWPQMPRRLQVTIGSSLPRFILGFLKVDDPAIRAFLRRHYSVREAETILEESYPPETLLANARAASRATLRVFRDAGAFELREVADAMFEQGFPLHSRSASK